MNVYCMCRIIPTWGICDVLSFGWKHSEAVEI
jgi:hypothetical protein